MVSTPSFVVIGATLGYAAALGTLSASSLAVALIVGFLIHETVGRQRAPVSGQPAAEAVQASAGGGQPMAAAVSSKPAADA
jgi:hypothetical protein